VLALRRGHELDSRDVAVPALPVQARLLRGRTAVVRDRAAPCERRGLTGELPSSRWRGVVRSIHVAAAAGAPMATVAEVRAVEGRGLEGDRYFDGTGTYSTTPGTGRHVTLIELEALEALRAETGIELDPGEARRNIVTCGVPLNHLVGLDFEVGPAVFRGMRLCEPCTYLSGLLEQDVLAGLIHRGGLRADLVRGGLIRSGDVVTPR
jgi:MOSC domain-containing protein YiiM